MGAAGVRPEPSVPVSMKRVAWFAAPPTTAAAVLAGATIVLLWPRCETWVGVPGLVPPTRECTSHPALAALLCLASVVLAAAALRVLSSPGRSSRR